MKIHVKPAKRLRGSLSVPADKSIAQRAALFSLLSEETSVISNYPHAEDPQTALECIQKLGARIEKKHQQLFIKGTGRTGIRAPDGAIDCRNSGTVMRLLSGIVAGSGVETVLTGDASLRLRPMNRIIKPLTMMGADITSADGGYPPLQLRRNKPLEAIQFSLPVASAQLKSCILLAGLFGSDETRVLESVRSRNHTEIMLGLPVEYHGDTVAISSSSRIHVPPQHVDIPGDFSAAAFWIVAASIVEGSDVLIEKTGINPTRCAALHIMERMGADIEIHNRRYAGKEEVADIRVRSARPAGLMPTEIHPAEIPNAIDELPVLCVAMAFADGVSTIRGAEELRYKESDRLAAIQQMLTSGGIKSEALKDGLIIHGNPAAKIKSASHDSRNDHRIAMAAAILSLKADDVSEIQNAGAAAVSYPDFWKDLDKLTCKQGG